VVTGTGSQAPHQPFPADISTGGRYILFRTAGNDIIPSYSTTLHLFLEDTCLGVSTGCNVTYTAIDVRADGSESEGNQANDAHADEQPSLSKDGRYVVFSSTDQQLVSGGTPHVSEVYVRDTCNGADSGCTPLTTLVSADPTALSKDYRSFIGYRSISEHGRYVAFAQEALDTTANAMVFSIRVRDTCIGADSECTPSISTASVDTNGAFGTAHTSFYYPSISADGHYVASMNVGNGQVYLSTTGY
jgi:Tol biopolymer transport system component